MSRLIETNVEADTGKWETGKCVDINKHNLTKRDGKPIEGMPCPTRKGTVTRADIILRTRQPTYVVIKCNNPNCFYREENNSPA